MWSDRLADARQTERDGVISKEPLAVVRDEARADLNFLEPARWLSTAVEVNLSRFVREVMRETLKFERSTSADDERNTEKILQREDDLFPAQLFARPAEEFACWSLQPARMDLLIAQGPGVAALFEPR